ncbi:MAG: hypothetical protein KatS3mg104_3104 [Phycisphaerae bacterium]|nr:MAG: hypothetical protein KatS3mg104_3104 [Phycisphaerae bacterium]
MDPVRVGVIGAGKISDQYLGIAKNFPIIQIVAVADINPQVARTKAEQFGIPRVCSVDDIYQDPSIEIILNLTVPKAHVPIGLRAIEAGKHTYAEKPLGINRDEGFKLIETAKTRNLRTGCAPDTFLGAGLQTARKLIDDGAIGKPVAFTAFMISRGTNTGIPAPNSTTKSAADPCSIWGLIT